MGSKVEEEQDRFALPLDSGVKVHPQFSTAVSSGHQARWSPSSSLADGSLKKNHSAVALQTDRWQAIPKEVRARNQEQASSPSRVWLGPTGNIASTLAI